MHMTSKLIDIAQISKYNVSVKYPVIIQDNTFLKYLYCGGGDCIPPPNIIFIETQTYNEPKAGVKYIAFKKNPQYDLSV